MMNIRDKILAYLYQKVEASIEEIANVIREEKDEVEAVLNRLKSEGLVTKKQKGLLRKREVVTLTPTGLEEAKRAYEKLEAEAKRVEEILASRSITGDEELPQDIMNILPLLMALSLIDLAVLQGIIVAEAFDIHDDIDSM